MELDEDPRELIRMQLARERKVAAILKYTPVPFTANWHGDLYACFYQLLFPTRQEIAYIERARGALCPELLSELRIQDPKRLELSVEDRVGFDASENHFLNLVLPERKLTGLTTEQAEFAELSLKQTPLLRGYIPLIAGYTGPTPRIDPRFN